VAQVNIVSRVSFARRFDSSNFGSLFRVISQLQRHGARYPTTGLAKEIKEGTQKTASCQDLQPFETFARKRLSPLCSMFSEEDFEIYEYAGDLEKFYNRGCAYIVPSPLVCSSSHCSLDMGVFGIRSGCRVHQRTHWAPREFPCTSRSASQ
jgi:hypothetical protein